MKITLEQAEEILAHLDAADVQLLIGYAGAMTKLLMDKGDVVLAQDCRAVISIIVSQGACTPAELEKRIEEVSEMLEQGS